MMSGRCMVIENIEKHPFITRVRLKRTILTKLIHSKNREIEQLSLARLIDILKIK